MTPDILLVIGILFFVILLFIFEWVRVDVAGILMMVLLPLLGLVTPAQAISGLSSNAVVSIIAVIIIGSGLDKTGVMKTLSHYIFVLSGKSERRIMFLISGAVAGISGFMQNIGAAALFLPAVRRIARQTGVPISRVLLPMGYCAIIGGCLTLVGSSPLIMLNDLMRLVDRDVTPFGLFSVTPIGLALVLAAILYFMLFRKWILPERAPEDRDHPMSAILESLNEDVGTLFELHVPWNFKTQTIGSLHLRSFFYTSVVAIARHRRREKSFAPMRDTEIHAGDHVAVVGPPDRVKEMARQLGWEIRRDLVTFAEDLSPNEAGLVKAIIAPRSKLYRHTVSEIRFRKKFQVNPLAVLREDEVFVANLSDLVLRPGDALLLQGRWERFHHLKDSPDLIFTTPIQGEILREDKAVHALACLSLSLVMILGFNVQLSIALLSGALGMVLLRVMSIDEAYGAVDWMTVFLLAGLIPLGMAFENTGTAKLIASTITQWLGDEVTPILLMSVIAILSSFFTLVISNVGAAVLLVPLSMNLALNIGADPRIAALVVAVATSNSFVLPTHQVNALIMRPGSYRTTDFVRAGIGMTLLYLVVMIAAVWAFFGIH